MRIQEMRSGLTHLKKKADAKGPDQILEMRSILESDLRAVAERFEREMPTRKAEPVPSPVNSETVREAAAEPAVRSELEDTCWAVVSFERVEAAHLTYLQAISVLADLELRGVSGLCIITDEAAIRIKKT